MKKRIIFLLLILLIPFIKVNAEDINVWAKLNSITYNYSLNIAVLPSFQVLRCSSY